MNTDLSRIAEYLTKCGFEARIDGNAVVAYDITHCSSGGGRVWYEKTPYNIFTLAGAARFANA